jgi:hypothetical protein
MSAAEEATGRILERQSRFRDVALRPEVDERSLVHRAAELTLELASLRGQLQHERMVRLQQFLACRTGANRQEQDEHAEILRETARVPLDAVERRSE